MNDNIVLAVIIRSLLVLQKSMITDLQFLLVLLVSRTVLCYISTPHNPEVRFVGEDAIFNWTTSDGKKIYSAKFGIAKDNMPNPKFIDINVYNNIVYFNKDMDPRYRNRVDFIGNLTAGRAWFILNNLTISDTNKYIAMIRGESGIFPYIVKLKVKEKGTTLRTKAGKRPVKPMVTASPIAPLTERITRTEQLTEISMTSESQKGNYTVFILLLTFGLLSVAFIIFIIAYVIKVKWGDRLSTCTFQPLSKGLVPHNEEIV